jgi:hypothetical protein
MQFLQTKKQNSYFGYQKKQAQKMISYGNNLIFFLLLIFALGLCVGLELCFLATATRSSSRKAPARPSVAQYGVTYREKTMGVIVAVEQRSGKTMWEKKIYDVVYQENLETDVQDVWLTKMEIVGNELVMIDEKKRKWTIELETNFV